MDIRVDLTGSVTGLRQHCRELQQGSAEGLLILACDANGFTPAGINQELQQMQLPVVGGIFPGILLGQKHFERGTITVGLPTRPDILTVPELSQSDFHFDLWLEQNLPTTGHPKTALVLVDSFAKRIDALLEGLFETLGLEINYLGGGAGSLSMQPGPCLLSNAGLLQDQAIIALLEQDCGIGVKHGWHKIAGPFQVTESRHNTIYSIDWQPAFDVYRRAIEDHSGQTIRAEAFYEDAKHFPFGISKLNAEHLVRDPSTIGVDGQIHCFGEVPEGSFIDILTGDCPSLIEAAGEARSRAHQALGSDRPEVTVLIDCASRALFLDQSFPEELAALQQPGSTLFGALSMGEIANCGRDYLEFFNKTAVVGAFRS